MSRRFPSIFIACLWLMLVGLALWLRLSLVTEFHSAAGDSVQYHQLAQELRHAGRFAYGPEPEPLTWTRSPGYPAFLALLSPARPLSLPEQMVVATRANAVLDVGTALLVAAMSRLLGLRLLAQLFGFGAVVLMPPMFMLASVGLSESLVTFLLALATALTMAARQSDRPKFWTVAASMVLGLALYVRLDAVLTLPALLLLLWVSSRPRSQRVALVLLCLGITTLTYAPWPLRSWRAFGVVHVGSSPWIDAQGVPLPMGMMRWTQTWATGRVDGEGYCFLAAALHRPLPPSRPNIILPTMYDDEAERQRLVALYNQYSQEGLSPAVDSAFYALAAERLRRHPLRTLVVLPLYRIRTQWSPMPSYELAMRSKLLGLPTRRADWNRFGSLLLLLSLLGASMSMVDRQRRGTTLALLAIPFVRSVVFAYLHPIPLQRYFVEAIPVLLVFSGYALAWPLLRLYELLRIPLSRLLPRQVLSAMDPASSAESAPRSELDAS